MTTTVATPKITMISLDDIADHPNNPRFKLGDLDELASSIVEHGILQPLTVVQRLDAKKGETPWWLLMGHRRRSAAELAALPVVPCIVRSDLDTIPKQIETMLEENDHREDLTPVEEAAAYEQLLAFDYTPEQIARVTGKSEATVAGRLQLMKLSQSVRDKVHARELTLADAAALVEFSDDAKDLARAELYVGTGNWSWVREDIRRIRAGREKRPKVIAKLKDKGIRIVKPPAAWEYDTSAKIRPVTQLAQPDGTDYSKPATEHAGCEGHVAVVSDMGKITFGCDRPDIHPKRTRTTGHQPDPASEQLDKDLETASRLRVAFMRSLMEQQATEDLQRRLLVSTVVDLAREVFEYLDEEDFAAACGLLGITPPPDALVEEQYEAWKNALAADLATWQIPNLIGAMACLRVANCEFRLEYSTATWSWRHQDEDLVRYIDWLKNLGYEVSDVEREQLEPAEAVAS